MAPPKCTFSCRIVNIDSYTAPPTKDLDACYSEFRSSAVERVPVIRIFGATPLGQKTCLHVHGVFPYIYVPCPPTAADCGGGKYMQQLAKSINHALQVSLGVGSKPGSHVFKIVLVKGIPLYGYHDSEQLFLKVYFYNPAMVRRTTELLLSGAVMGTALQPHEAHVPYVLQFMIDYNLYGMNHIHLSSVKFRLGGEASSSQTAPRSPTPTHPLTSPLSPSPPFFTPSQTHWKVDTLPTEMILSSPRVSVCELEADTVAADIVNRLELSLGDSAGFPGLAAIWEEERTRRRVLGIDTPLSPPPSPPRSPVSSLPKEARLRTEFDQIVHERLGLSSDSEPEDSPLTLSSMAHCSQSCDLEVHRPISREKSDDVTASHQEGDASSPLVDEDAVHRSWN